MNKKLDGIKKVEDDLPFPGSWNKLYTLVIISLAIVILLIYFFTKAFE
jgi:hypothetical protein